MKTMRAIHFSQHGTIETLRYGDVEIPEPGPGEVRIRVRAAALNHLDIWVRRGWLGLKVKMPHITGSDIAGEVDSPAAGWEEGDRVVVYPGVNLRDDRWTRTGEPSASPAYRVIGEHLRGGLAEYVVVPTENLLRLPDGLSFVDGAAPPLVATTCWRMLLDRARLRPGETVLVVGAGGGLNALTIQLAKSFGCRVIALTSSEEKMNKARRLGADDVINYVERKRWEVNVLGLTDKQGVDLVVDNVGEKTLAQSMRSVRHGGRIVSVGNTSGHKVSFDNRMMFGKQIAYIGSTMGSRQDFIDAMRYLWENEIAIPVDRVEKLDRGIEMIEYLEAGRQFGKIVLEP